MRCDLATHSRGSEDCFNSDAGPEPANEAAAAADNWFPFSLPTLTAGRLMSRPLV